MKRFLFLTYGLICYVVTLGTLTYLIGYSTTVFVPHHLDTGIETPIGLAILINIGLVTLFGLQHSIMARPAFKAWWTRLIPKPIERSTYILVASLFTLLLMWQWRPLTQSLWQVQNEVVANILYGIAVGGWLLVVAATLLIDHFDLFGMRQVVLYFRKIPYTPVQFKSPALYKIVRHPMQLGVVIGIWVTPAMSLGHLLFALLMTVYIFIGLYYEERDLIRDFGERYLAYRRTTPKLFPMPKFGNRPVTPKQPAPSVTEIAEK